MFCPFIPSRNSVLSFHSRCSVFPPGVLPFLPLKVFCPSFPRRSSDFPSLEVFCPVLSKIGSALCPHCVSVFSIPEDILSLHFLHMSFLSSPADVMSFHPWKCSVLSYLHILQYTYASTRIYTDQVHCSQQAIEYYILFSSIPATVHSHVHLKINLTRKTACRLPRKSHCLW